METDGDFPADRLETVLTAIYHCVFLTACAFGLDPDAALTYINDADALKPKKWKAPTLEELRRTAEAKDRALFATIKDRFE